MASSIHIGLILFALLHLGRAYSIWGPRSEQNATLDAMLNIFKSVNKNPMTFDIDEEAKLLGQKLSTLFKQVHGLRLSAKDLIGDNTARYIAEAINVLVYHSGDPRLEETEQQVNKVQGVFIHEYLHFLDRKMLPDETKEFILKAIKLDSDQNYEHSQTMSTFYEAFASASNHLLTLYRRKFPTTRAFLNELLKYNHKNEWDAFVMITTAYKLQSLESNNDNYLKDFKRLRKQMMAKLELHDNKFYAALGIDASQVHMYNFEI